MVAMVQFEHSSTFMTALRGNAAHMGVCAGISHTLGAFLSHIDSVSVLNIKH